MIESAIRFINQPPLWLAIGKSSPWPDDTNPPNENSFTTNSSFMNQVQPLELIAFKQIDVMSLVVPDFNGNIIYQNTKYSYVDINNAVAQLARWLYMRAILNAVEQNSFGQVIINNVEFRQTCVMSGIQPLAPYTNEVVLAPNQVATYDSTYPSNLQGMVMGRLVMLTNHKPRVACNGILKNVVEIVREFRG